MLRFRVFLVYIPSVASVTLMLPNTKTAASAPVFFYPKFPLPSSDATTLSPPRAGFFIGVPMLDSLRTLSVLITGAS